MSKNEQPQLGCNAVVMPRRTPWEIAEAWYNAEQIHECIVRHRCGAQIPTDTQSVEFANWLTHEYRLAMAKGVQLGRDGSEDKA